MTDIITYPKTHSPWKRDEKGLFIDEPSQPWVEVFTHSPFYATEKVDGTNTRLSFTEGILGRTANAQWNGQVLDDLGGTYDSFVKAVEAGLVRTDALLFGETVGPKVQGNPYGFAKDQPHEFVLFDVWSPTLGFAEREIVHEVAAAVGVRTPETIPAELDFGASYSLAAHVDGIFRSLGAGMELESMLFPGADAEGVILRPLREVRTGRGDRVQLKIKFRDVKRLIESQNEEQS